MPHIRVYVCFFLNWLFSNRLLKVQIEMVEASFLGSFQKKESIRLLFQIDQYFYCFFLPSIFFIPKPAPAQVKGLTLHLLVWQEGHLAEPTQA